MRLGSFLLLALGSVAVGGCSSAHTETGDTGAGVDAALGDAAASDVGIEVDASADAAVADDSATIDAAPRPDAGMCEDLPADPTRPVAIQCSPCRTPGPGGGVGGACATDADCTAGDNGRCSFGRIGAFCDYDLCFADADCAAAEVCLCDGASSGTGGGNVCIPAECHVDGDCGAGFACSPTLGSCGHHTNFVAYRCHRAGDECRTDGDCAVGYCAFDETLGHWLCSSSECAG